jgi:CBS domain-containing protein
MAVGEICSREVVFARRGESLRVAAQLMREKHVGALAVVDERNGDRIPVGIITDRDIVIAVVAKGLDADTLLVGEAMSADLVTARESDGVSECIAKMRAKGVRRVPVVDARGALVGIVSADDFLDLLAEELSGLARMIASEQRREAKTRAV